MDDCLQRLELLSCPARLKPKLLPPARAPGSCLEAEKEAWPRRIRGYVKDAERMGHSLYLGILTVWGRKDMEELRGRLESTVLLYKSDWLGFWGKQCRLIICLVWGRANAEVSLNELENSHSVC
jgi:hypothetical protein